MEIHELFSGIFEAAGRTGLKTIKKEAFFLWGKREQSCMVCGHYSSHIYMLSWLQERTQKADVQNFWLALSLQGHSMLEMEDCPNTEQ